MANIIKLLLAKNDSQKTEKLNEEAISICLAAYEGARKSSRARSNKNTKTDPFLREREAVLAQTESGADQMLSGSEMIMGGDSFMPLLEKNILKQLSGVNLLDNKYYQQIYRALDRWEIKSSLDADSEEEEQSLANLARVKDMLYYHVLPALRAQQQKEALWEVCVKYFNHLSESAINEYNKSTPNVTSISLLKEKRKAIAMLYNSLRTKNESVSQQLDNFKNLLGEKRALLETRRDSTEIKFLNTITGILAKGINYFFGLWKTEGGKAGKEMDSILENSQVKGPRFSSNRPKGA